MRIFVVIVVVLIALATISLGMWQKAPVRAEVARKQPVDEPQLPPHTVRQGFPAASFEANDLAKCDTAWEIEWDLTHPNNRPYGPPGSVFRIRSAKFMWKDRTGKPQWITVVRMLELAEIYVPYDNGWTAFLDIHDMSFHTTRARREFLGPNCVAPGEILRSPNPAWDQTVHKEVHDDGIRWMTAETSSWNQVSDKARRGEKLILWATYYGANYRYLTEYSFGDDGMIAARIGPTGQNFFDRREDLGDTHMHIGCWRMEPDLGDPIAKTGGPKDNDVLLVRRNFDDATEKFRQVAKPFNKDAQGEASEGSARWNAEEFTAIRVQSKSRKNTHGRNVSYELVPQRLGTLRQLQHEGGTHDADMDFINNDFWVTRSEPSHTAYIDVPHYAKEHRSLTGQPVTLWHCAPILHFPRSEDFGSEDGRSSYSGTALTFWTGFYLKPRDLFDGTPLYQGTPRRPRFRADADE
jgi:hypothetical protein